MESVMNHKSIILLLSSVFSVGLINSVLLLKSSISVTPEAVFSFLFIVMNVACILFFSHKNINAKKHQKIK